MDTFERKYGVKEDEKTRRVHASRRMFCIYQDQLVIAEPNLPYSHAVWFEKNGWMSEQEDSFMNDAVRGIVDSEGDVYFYIGYDFRVNRQIEPIFFRHLGELVEKLGLMPDARIFGGSVKPESGKRWLPRKEYGQIKDNL
ncbi:hypothetical protein A3K73_07155 [Candidatus Pacearchaeota archaeon RBG_13_36_9]|nr:MAG: hypothetical protein A3K73_07155 [Candidatus Pacearchaeota archaeon RBG_13_36_9]